MHLGVNEELPWCHREERMWIWQRTKIGIDFGTEFLKDGISFALQRVTKNIYIYFIQNLYVANIP